ncbi:MAG: hypothetical protein ACKO2L_00820 [Planctomycetaceae bacterium]
MTLPEMAVVEMHGTFADSCFLNASTHKNRLLRSLAVLYHRSVDILRRRLRRFPSPAAGAVAWPIFDS